MWVVLGNLFFCGISFFFICIKMMTMFSFLVPEAWQRVSYFFEM